MNYIRILSVLLLAGMLLQCKHKDGEYHDLNEKIEAESTRFHDTLISSETYIGDIETIEITEGGHTFLIPERKGQMKSYACTECHSKSLSEIKNATIAQGAHWDIKVEHADENAMNCATCHSPKNMDELHTLTGSTVDFNQSYKLCSQCHTTQFEDWKGGAHGKNIGGWAPPRAAMTCVNCHNPHEPAIESRWPVQFNIRKGQERE